MRTFVHTKYAIQIVKVRDADGNVETIRTTDEHPFWVNGVGWVSAKDLTAGMRLDEADGSDDSAVLSSTTELHPEGIKVYNFEVEGDHTYFVEDGQGDRTAVWVHNTCQTAMGVIRQNAKDWRALRDSWDASGYGSILSQANRELIAAGSPPTVDAAWITAFPGDESLLGEQIRMHHVGGYPLTVPLPVTRHIDAHMPGGFRYNRGGPGVSG